jgi:hypothetical protein
MWLHYGGAERDRTDDLLLARQALSQLSYSPIMEECSSKTEQNQCPCLNLRRKEVIHPHLPVRIPCYDFTPIICPTFGGWLLAVTSPTSGVANSRGVTGGVYKTRERIHRSMLICDY